MNNAQLASSDDQDTDPFVRVRRRPTFSSEVLILLIAAFMVGTANGPWWHTVTAGRAWSSAATWGFVAACFVLLVAVHFALIAIFSARWIAKPLLTILVIGAAGAAYYMRAFAVILDPSMIQNVLRTDSREARDLLSWGMAAWVVLWSVLPVSFIWWVRIRRRALLRAVLVRVGTVFLALLVAFLSVLAISRDFTSLMRNQHEARYLITPANIIYGLAVQSTRGLASSKGPREVVGADATVKNDSVTSRPRVLVLMVGETARAENFSLMGYARETNPELKKLNVIAFTRVKSCGTSTEVSVPCMFSRFGRENYNERKIRSSEGLLDVLAHAGYTIKWIDNQSGCKGVCTGKGIDVSKIDAHSSPDLCDGTECLDGILVQRLASELGQIHDNTVVVMHMMGNHGPAYFKRYPQTFRRFTPDCTTAQLRDCTRGEVVNAYDNAILYTDHVLAGIVNTLQQSSDRIDSVMLYLSDHGESLGEKGLYLHGIPYAIAPSQQTHIPMVLWLSPGITSNGDVNDRCVRARTNQPYSHDNLFDSVLGVLNVSTAVYRAERDIFARCRGAPSDDRPSAH